MDVRLGSDFNYKMTENDIIRLIQLRATNSAIFTGKRNSAMPAWRAMLKELGLHGKLTARQLKKKWENLKRKYKDFKCPPCGMENQVNPNSWRWYHLMDQAMAGHLAGTARILNPSLFDMEDDDAAAPSPIPNKKVCLRPEGCEGNIFEFWAKAQLGEGTKLEDMEETPYTDAATEEIRRATVECEMALREEGKATAENERATSENKEEIRRATVECEMALREEEKKKATAENEKATSENRGILGEYQRTAAEREGMADDGVRPVLINTGRNIERETAELERQIAELEKEREALEKEQAEFDRERLIMDRERDVVNRERAAVERSRASQEKDRAVMERERAALERDRAVLDRDRALIEREKAELLREKEASVKYKIARSYGSTDVEELDSSTIERRERLLSLFERLIEKL